MDRRGRCRFVDLNDTDAIHAISIAFDPAALRRELHVVDRHGRVFRGFEAVRRLLWIHPLGWLPASLLHIPVAIFLGRPLYRAIARRRHAGPRGKAKKGGEGGNVGVT